MNISKLHHTHYRLVEHVGKEALLAETPPKCRFWKTATPIAWAIDAFILHAERFWKHFFIALLVANGSSTAEEGGVQPPVEGLGKLWALAFAFCVSEAEANFLEGR